MRVPGNLDGLFRPRGCAILGASTDPNKAGHQIVRNMKTAGYPGELYLVNPRGGQIDGTEFHRSLADIDGTVEMVVWAVPAPFTASGVADLQQRHRRHGDVRIVVTVAAGFAETGAEEGRRWQDLLVSTCKQLGIRVLGPNCVGVIDTGSGVDTTFIMGTDLQPGGISFVSQSGAVGAWLVESWAARPYSVGFNKFVSVGNMADVSLVEILDYLREDESTRVVGMYMEGYEQGREMARALEELGRVKPVVVLKVGESEHGARAARSHTGSMAGADRVYDGVFRQVGVRRVRTVGELSATLSAFDQLPAPEGRNLFVLTQAGGPGIYCTDILAAGGEVDFARVSADTRAALRDVLPPFASVCQPEGHADMTAAASAVQHGQALETVLRDDAVHAALVLTVPVLFVPPEAIAREIIAAHHRLQDSGIDKPFMPVLLSGDVVEEGRAALAGAGLMAPERPEDAARALGHLVAYYRRRRGDVDG